MLFIYPFTESNVFFRSRSGHLEQYSFYFLFHVNVGKKRLGLL